MLRPRIIPCLLVHKGGLVKTTRFAEPRYVGDPLNAVKLFNEKEADELMILDIDATRTGALPDFTRIGRLAVECRMPLCYGGGVQSCEQASRIIGLGVEKVALSAAAIARPTIVREIAREIGSQSVVVVIDVRLRQGAYTVWTHNGTRDTGFLATHVAERAQAMGAGEIVVNAIDRDGTMSGYDLVLARLMRAATALPLTVLGGAASLADIGALFSACGVVGAAAGSLFVFKGAYRAVLLNYPSGTQRDALGQRTVATR
jgi:imidazole glycerol-phosphate synthase subunit HisF